MSKDIRSFFLKKGGTSVTRSNESTSREGKKRSLRVIESDSEDDVVVVKPLKKKQKEEKTQKKSPVKPKEKSVNACSFFGSSPVKQKPQSVSKVNKVSSEKQSTKDKIKRKKEELKATPKEEFSIANDDGFDESLLLINERELEEFSNAERKKISEKVKKTPEKNAEDSAMKVTTPGSSGSKGKKNSLLDSGQKRRNAESYQRYLNRPGPKNPGSKEIPKGKPNCLQGLTFVITGVLDSMEREDVTYLIIKCGGRITGSISRKTNFIVVGEDAGASKLEKANKLGTKKLTEDDLLELIRSKSGEDHESSSSQENFIEGTPKKVTESKCSKSENNLKRKIESCESPKKLTKTAGDVEAPKLEAKTKGEKSAEGRVKVPNAKRENRTDFQTDSVQECSSANKKEAEDMLWVDKYKPKTTKQIIGQSGEKSNVKKLFHWLENWYKNHVHAGGKKQPKPAPWQSHDGSAFKAALLSGPPGVGKTTSVQLVCKELGFDIIEFNASDTRSKKLLQEEISELLKSKSIRCYVEGNENVQSQHVLVMDEVDGMAGNEDRGGIQELIQVIKNSKVPVICICNDRNHTKIRSLANYCYDLRYCKPRIEQIKAAAMSICFKEGLKIPGETLEDIILNANQDVRQVLHNLSLWAARDKSPNLEQMKKDSAKAKKPLNLGPWDVTRKVFSLSDHAAMTLREKEELFFQDYSLIPLFVQDTFVRVKPHKARGDKKKTLDLISKAADSIVIGDVIERMIRSENAWGLLPVQAIFSSVLPGHYMEGHVQGQIQFPVWLGKNSKRKRFERMLQELQAHMRLSISGNAEDVNLDYLHILRDSITGPLLRNGTDGVAETLKVMSDYNLTKEDVDTVMELSLWPEARDPFAAIGSKVKAALTRAYNKEGRPVPYATSAYVKKLKIADVEYQDAEEEEPAVDEEDLESDAMIKKGKQRTVEDREESKGKAKKESKETKKERRRK